MAKKTNLEAIRELRASDPMWAQFSEANLLRRYYEARKRQREGKLAPAETLLKVPPERDK